MPINTHLFQWIAIFTLSLFYSIAGAAETSIALYGSFETSINSKEDYSNPFDYDEVSFNAEFISPDKRVFKVSSFYDGRNLDGEGVWKIRFMPDEPGLWQYAVKTNNLKQTVQSGEFTVAGQTTNAGNHGHVKVDTQNARYLIHDDSTPHYWIGGKWISARDYGPENKAGQLNKGIDGRTNVAFGHKSNQQLTDYLDLLVEYKHNGLLLKIAQYPLEKDRVSWDLEWIRRGEWLVKEALERGIYVQVNLFDTWSRDQNQYFAYSMQGAKQAFDVWSDGDDKFKKNYLRYIISRFSSFANVYWELGNEMEHRPNCGSCFVKLANNKYLPWIREFDPYDLPIGLSEVIWRDTTADIGFLHQTNVLPDESMRRPVIMNELVSYTLPESRYKKIWRKIFGKKLSRGLWHDDAISNEDLRYVYRRTFWKVFTHGGSGSSEATWLNIENTIGDNVLNVMRDHSYLSDLIHELLPMLNTMNPIQHIVTSSAKKENISSRGNSSISVTYFDAGYKQSVVQESITISNLTGKYEITWLSPSSGEVLEVDMTTLDGEQEIMRPSYVEDIVLLLKIVSE